MTVSIYSRGKRGRDPNVSHLLNQALTEKDLGINPTQQAAESGRSVGRKTQIIACIDVRSMIEGSFYS